MEPEDLQAVLRAQPFVPFNIVFSTGKTILIRHPETVEMFESRFEHYSLAREEMPIREQKFHYAVRQIVSFEMLNPNSPRTVDGSQN